MPQTLYDLDIWQEGYELVLEVYEIADTFPSAERFGLVDQLKRSANAVIAIIAESQGRYTYADKIRVLYQSRGELFETRSHLRVTHGLGYLPKERFKSLDQSYERLLIRLNAYIKHLARNRIS